MSKLNERLTLVANLSVVAGIVFLAVEMGQNTSAIQAQTRDSMTEKQMMMSEWVVTTPELAATMFKAQSLGLEALDDAERMTWALFVAGELREWENSYYQYLSGLYRPEDFEPRLTRWRSALNSDARRQRWEDTRLQYSPSFRAEIDRIVAEVEAAQ
jgi:hypothetical protein